MFKDRTRRPTARYEIRSLWANGGRSRTRKRTSREARFYASDLRAAEGCIEAAVFNLVTGEIVF